MVSYCYMSTWVELYRMAKKAIQLWTDSYIALLGFLYSFRCEAIQLCEVTSIRLLLRVGIKVVDEWQISLDYVRGSNIYVRGFQDLRTWSLRLRTQTEKNHYGKVLFSSREGHFSLRWLRGILAIKRRACISIRRGLFGELGVPGALLIWSLRIVRMVSRREVQGTSKGWILLKDLLRAGRQSLRYPQYAPLPLMCRP